MSRPRTAVIAVGVLALLLALTPFVPRGGDDEEALRPSGDATARTAAVLPANAVGRTRIDASMQAEIDRVVAAGRSVGPAEGKFGRAAQLVRCAELDGQRYCLGVGWTDDTEAAVRARVGSAARVAARTTARDSTGDLDAAAALARTARMTPRARATAERAELRMAARSVAKVWLLRHEILGEPLPADFLDRHPEARAASRPAARTKTATPTPAPAANSTATPVPSASPSPIAPAKTKTVRDYPRRSQILDEKQVTEQTLTYWCGPTSMQMIAWGWAGKARRQKYWARQLGTTTSGTGITDIVRVINRDTGWDGAKYAGTYITLDVGSWTYGQWMLLMMRHIHDYRAPVVLHPVLRKRYYPYLDDDASGHFQVGRGFDKNGKKPALLGYFEPWNQQRFDPSEPAIARVQWRNAYKSYRANQDHFLHNVGV